MAPGGNLANGSSSTMLSLSSKSKSKSLTKSSSQLSLVVKLQLSSDVLSSFDDDDSSNSKDANKSPEGDVTPKRSDSGAEDKLENGLSKDNTPAAGEDASAMNGDASSRKGVPGPKPGTKRGGPGAEANGVAKPRGKPGPKKKIKLDGENGPTSTAPGHKLGPKANQGAINAGLRALDRTEKAPRRWHRKIFQLKSFTGVGWEAPLWKTPQSKGAFSKAEDPSDAAASSDAKPENQNSAVGSETSNNVADKSNIPPTASSPPAPQPAVVDSPA